MSRKGGASASRIEPVTTQPYRAAMASILGPSDGAGCGGRAVPPFPTEFRPRDAHCQPAGDSPARG
jgi:hypothetical protein